MVRRAAALALAGLLLSGCATVATAGLAPRAEITAPVELDVFSLQVGDCTTSITSGTANRITALPCAQEHAWEVFAITSLDADEWPGAGEVQDQSEKFCSTEFKAFVGLSVGKSDYDLIVLQPTKDTWTSAADRQVTCFAGRDGGKLTGSLQDAKK